MYRSALAKCGGRAGPAVSPRLALQKPDQARPVHDREAPHQHRIPSQTTEASKDADFADREGSRAPSRRALEAARTDNPGKTLTDTDAHGFVWQRKKNQSCGSVRGAWLMIIERKKGHTCREEYGATTFDAGSRRGAKALSSSHPGAADVVAGADAS